MGEDTAAARRTTCGPPHTKMIEYLDSISLKSLSTSSSQGRVDRRAPGEARDLHSAGVKPIKVTAPNSVFALGTRSRSKRR